MLPRHGWDILRLAKRSTTTSRRRWRRSTGATPTATATGPTTSRRRRRRSAGATATATETTASAATAAAPCDRPTNGQRTHGWNRSWGLVCCAEKRHHRDVGDKCVALLPWGLDLQAHLLGTRPDFRPHMHGARQLKRHGFESGVAMGNCELEQKHFCRLPHG